ncbi:hypothetical protein JHK85_023219 [Glycine max]|nr:hypothetical protein JHK85_023219 [Glycine max]
MHEVYANDRAEEIMGQAIQELDWKLSDIIISTSCNDKGLSCKHIIEGTKASLKCLDMEYNMWMFSTVTDYEKALKDVREILTLDPNYMMFYGHMHGDQLRDRIHVIVKKKDLKNWEVELKEWKTYYMYNFRVVPNDGQYKVCAHPFKLFFTGGTTLRQVDLAEIPLKSFEFKSFEDIDNGNYDPNMLIGELVLVLGCDFASRLGQGCVLGFGFLEVWLRYRLEVMVYHNEQSTKFLCWDHGCINLIGQSDDEVNRLKIVVNYY